MIQILNDIPKSLQKKLKADGIFGDRAKALEKFFSLQSESMKHGLSIKTNLEEVDFSRVLIEEETEFMHSHSNLLGKDVNILKFNEIEDSEDLSFEQKEEIKRIISKKFGSRINKMDYLHIALSEIRVLVFNENIKLDETFEIDNKINGNSYNHLIIMIGKNSKVNLSIKTSSGKDTLLGKDGKKERIITDFTDIILEDNAKSNLIEFRNLTNRDVVYGRKSLHLGKDAVFEWISIDKDSKLAIIEQYSYLEGENSKSTMNNLLCGKDSEYMIYDISEHTGKSTESLIKTKSGLKSSRAVVKGLIRINKDAESSSGYQKSDILLIDENSKGISIPDLEIHNEKVKCTHGSTISRIDENKIFYLQSRGLSKKESETLMIEGFYEDILKNIHDEKIRQEIREEVIEK